MFRKTDIRNKEIEPSVRKGIKVLYSSFLLIRMTKIESGIKVMAVNIMVSPEKILSIKKLIIPIFEFHIFISVKPNITSEAWRELFLVIGVEKQYQ